MKHDQFEEHDWCIEDKVFLAHLGQMRLASSAHKNNEKLFESLKTKNDSHNWR